MKPKYKILEDQSMVYEGRTLYRIQSLRPINGIPIGTLGGWVERSSNLSHSGNSWIHDEAKAMGSSRILGNAQLRGYAEAKGYSKATDFVDISRNARLLGHSKIFGHACVTDNAVIGDYAQVGDSTYIYGAVYMAGNSKLLQNAQLSGNVRLHGYATVRGDAKLFGDYILGWEAQVGNTSDVILSPQIGSRNQYTLIFRGATGWVVSCGCFLGSVAEFRRQVLQYHKVGSLYRKQYLAFLAMAKELMAMSDAIKECNSGGE